MSEKGKTSRINVLIRLIGLIIVIIGLLIVYTAYAGVTAVGEDYFIFAAVGIITFLVGLLTLTLRMK
jgi:hypothetical protein